MIEDPPILHLRRSFERPDPAKVAAFRDVQVSVIVDALGGSGGIDWRIKPIVAEQAHFCGVAVPCACGPADNLALFAAVAIARPGDVVLAATNEHLGCSVTGDLLIGMARNQGVVGFVTDGLVRDVVGLAEVGLPCFARGLSPNSPVRSGPGSAGLPIVLGGVAVDAGDVVVGDPDGVVVIPRARLNQAIEAVQAVLAAEAALLAKVKDGLKVPGFVADVLAGPGIREVS